MEISINMVETNINNSLTPEQATEKLISGWDSGVVKNRADVEKLLTFGADINITDENGVTVLMKAAKTIDDKECLNLLLKSGLSVSTRDNRGRTALIAALAGNKKENVKALIEAGANVNIKLEDYSMATPLMLACMHCDADVVKLLLEASASINSKDKFGYTALMIAIQLNKTDVVNLLLDNGAKVGIEVKNFAKTFPEFAKTDACARLMQI